MQNSGVPLLKFNQLRLIVQRYFNHPGPLLRKTNSSFGISAKPTLRATAPVNEDGKQRT